MLAGLRRVEHVGRVGEDDRLDAEHRPARRLISRMSLGSTQPGMRLIVSPLLLGRLGEVVDHALDHVGKAGDVRADVAGRVGVDDVLARRNLALVAGLVDDLRDVVADGLRQAGRVDGDHVGIVDGEDVR